MKHNLILIAFLAQTFMSSVAVFGQKDPSAKPATTSVKCTTNFNKQVHERANPPYWGPGTYFAYAPGKSVVCKFDNDFSVLLDMLGHETEYFYSRMPDLGHKRVINHKTVDKRFQKLVRKTDCYFMYNGAPDTLIYIGESQNVWANNQKSMVNMASKIWYIPIQNKEEVVKTVWRYLNLGYEIHNSTSGFYVGLTQSVTSLKMNTPYPEGFGTGGWKGICTPHRKMVFPEGFEKPGYSRPDPHFELFNYQDIMRANLLKKGFYSALEFHEADFQYALNISLEKDGFKCELTVHGKLMDCLPSGASWTKHIKFVREDFDRWKNGDQEFEKGMNMIKASIRPKPILLEEVLNYKAP